MNAIEIPPLGDVLLNGQKYLENRRTIVLGISPGNPHYHKAETLEKLFLMADNKSDKVLLFLPDKLSEHNYRALGSKNPEKSARIRSNWLRNKCKDAIKKMALSEEKFSFVKWMEEVESCPAYIEAFQANQDLYRTNDEFRIDVQKCTMDVLIKMRRRRENGLESRHDDSKIDIEEGIKYLLKELAYCYAVPKIYTNCEEFVFVYHRPWPILEKYCSGLYDGIVRPFVGYLVFD